MKISAGLGRLEDFEDYAAAGADEVFAGFVPWEWLERFGGAIPLNRREVLMLPAQIGTWDDMAALARLSAVRGVPVSVTLNAASYPPAAYPLIRDMALRLRDMGIHRFIVADPALMLRLRSEAGLRLHVSGEYGEFSPDGAALAVELGASRIIFHRKVSFAEMKAVTDSHPGLEYEAFALNERCHYTGAFCACLHGDRLPPLCRAPWRIGGVDREERRLYSPADPPDPDALGATGCGFCALGELERAGVTHLKLVGRGNHPRRMIRDIKAMRRALEILQTRPEDYTAVMKAELFPEGCPGTCYYPGGGRNA